MKGPRGVIGGIAVVLVGCVALVAALNADSGGRAAQEVARESYRGPVTPNFVGLRRTQALCQVREGDQKLIVDGYRENRPGEKIGRRWCSSGAENSVHPNPTVQRQVPAAGTPLDEDEPIRLRTECFAPQDRDPNVIRCL